MGMPNVAVRSALALGMGVLAVACGPESGGWPRLVPSPAAPFLSAEVATALDALREGRTALPPDAAAGREALDEADAALSRLKTFYLPVLEASRRAYNAHQLAALGDTERAQGELDRIETILLAAAEAGPLEVARELEEPLDSLEEARVSLASASPETPQRFEWLAERLELILLKGELVLKQDTAR
jgi:hypothetical protein